MPITSAPTDPTTLVVIPGRNGDRVHRVNCKRATMDQGHSFGARPTDYTTQVCQSCKPVLPPTPAAAAVKSMDDAEQARSAAIEVVDPDTMTARRNAAKAEHKALKAWKDGGEQGDRPATPNLEAVQADHDAGKTATQRVNGKAKGKGTPRVAQTVRFHHDGRPVSDAQNKISSVAYWYTKHIESDDSPRMSTAALKAMLIETGIKADELTTTEWEVELPNGIVLSTTI